jgi:hypothetical protein
MNYWPSSYYYPYGSYYPYVGDYYSYPSYQPNVGVSYAPPAQYSPSAGYQAQASQAPGQYDQYGQALRPAASAAAAAPSDDASTIYLIALQGGVVYAASSYQVSGGAVHYVTLDHAQKQTPLSGIDRDLTLRLNRQRGVPFNLAE